MYNGIIFSHHNSRQIVWMTTWRLLASIFSSPVLSSIFQTSTCSAGPSTIRHTTRINLYGPKFDYDSMRIINGKRWNWQMRPDICWRGLSWTKCLLRSCTLHGTPLDRWIQGNWCPTRRYSLLPLREQRKFSSLHVPSASCRYSEHDFRTCFKVLCLPISHVVQIDYHSILHLMVTSLVFQERPALICYVDSLRTHLSCCCRRRSKIFRVQPKLHHIGANPFVYDDRNKMGYSRARSLGQCSRSMEQSWFWIGQRSCLWRIFRTQRPRDSQLGDSPRTRRGWLDHIQRRVHIKNHHCLSHVY